MALQPQVKWAQRKGTLFVTVDVDEARDVVVEFMEKAIHLKCQDSAGQPIDMTIELHDSVKPEECRWISSRGIVMHLPKAEAKRWPNISSTKAKNIKVDWSKWMDTDDEEEAENKGNSDFDTSAFGGAGGFPGMGGMDFSSMLGGMGGAGGMGGLGGMGDMTGMPDFGAEDDDEEDVDDECEPDHEHGDNCCHPTAGKSAEVITDNAENQFTAA